MNFYVVGPTAVGKSALAVALAERCQAEIVNADPFQLYRGLSLLTARPEPALERRVPHHLLGAFPLSENLSAATFRDLALPVLASLEQRGKSAIIVSGSGLYVRALSDGFDVSVPPNHSLRQEVAGVSIEELAERLQRLDPDLAARTDLRNRPRIVRALEVSGCVANKDKPVKKAPRGVFLTRDRDDLYARINARIEEMFRRGVEEEVSRTANVSDTAEKALGLRQIRALQAGQISYPVCLEKIQQATRQYAKRQLTWFRNQTTFPQLNLTALSETEAVGAMSKLFARR